MALVLLKPASAKHSIFYEIGDPDGGSMRVTFPADDRRAVEPVHDVVTPHVPLALTLPEGPVRVLAIANYDYGRWPLELKQRLAVDIAVVYTRSSTDFGFHAGSVGMRDEDVAARLLQALNRQPQVIVSQVHFTAFPEDVQDRIRALIAAGVGYVGYLDGLDRAGYHRRLDVQRSIFASSVPFAGLRRLVGDFESEEKAAAGVCELYENDNGQRLAAVWDYPRDDGPPESSWLLYDWQPRLEEEAWNSLLARVILWAAGRGSGGLVVEMPSEPVMRGALPMTLAAEVDRPTEATRLEMLVFDRDGRRQHRAESTNAGPRMELEAPSLPAGVYFVLVRRHEGAAVCDWSLQALVVAAETEIATITLQDRIIAHEAAAQASISLSAAPPAGYRLTVEALDNFGRVLHRQTLPAAETLQVSVPTAGSLHLYNYVNVQLRDGAGSLIHEDRTSFIIRQPDLPTDELVVKMWGALGAGRHWHRSWKHAQDGIDVARADPEAAAIYNMRAEVGAANIRGFRMVSLTESYGLGRLLNTAMMRAAAQQWGAYPLFHYHLGDDFRYPEDWTPGALAYLAEWTKNRYQEIERLNEAWGVAYRDFSEVAPITPAEATAPAYTADQPAYGGLCRWVDQQLAREDMLIDFVGQLRAALAEGDPRRPNPLAIQNTVLRPAPNTGFNYWKLAEVFGNVANYPWGITYDVFRSARGPESRQAVYWGSYGEYSYPPYYAMEMFPWWSVFQDMSAINIWMGHSWYHPGRQALFPGVLAPDFGPLHGYDKSLAGIQELKAGIARMLFNAERQNDGVAVLYSQGSINASGLIASVSADDAEEIIPPLPKPDQWAGVSAGGDAHVYMNSWDGLTALIKDIGFNYDVVSDECVQNGALAGRDLSLLVLPLSLRLDDETAAAIRDFVRGGGVVLADFAPGLFDGRMRPGAPGVLADVFGVEYAGGLPAMVLDEAILDENAREVLGAPYGVSLPETASSLHTCLAMAEVRLRGATALARNRQGTPLLMIHEYGRGKAILFNMMARDYQIWRTLGEEGPFRRSAAAVLAWAGLKPRVECTIHAARVGLRLLPATNKVRFVDGATEYVGILRDAALRGVDHGAMIIMSDTRAHPTTIDFGRAAHVYDVRRGDYRGYRREIDALIQPARAELYALLPYEVHRLEGEAAYHPQTGRLEVRGRLVAHGDSVPGRHIIRLEVTDPEGRRRREYAANCLAAQGRLNHTVWLGLDPEPGRWRVNLKDVATGVSLLAEFEVIGRN